MRVLACFLLCSMLGGASEVLFAEAKNSIKGWLGRTARKFPVASDPGQMRVPFVSDYGHSFEPHDGGLDSQQSLTGTPDESHSPCEINTGRFEAATWKLQTAR